MRHRATSLTTLFTLAAGTLLSLSVRADKIYWNGGTGGSEADPLEFYDAASWTNGAGVAQLPSAAQDLFLTVDSLTYITNSASASTQIATALRFCGGDFVMLGPLKFNSFGYDGFSHSAPVSIDKRGDWSGNRFYLATSEGSSFTLTNRTGKLEVGTSYPARIANGTNSVASFVLESGSLTTVNSGQNLTIGYGTGAQGYFVQNGGTVTVAAKLNLGYNGEGNLTMNNGTFTVRGDATVLGANGGSSRGYLNLNGGIFETKYISTPSSNGGGTILFDGGTLKAASDGTLIQGVSKILVRIGARGGTIDTAGFTVNWGKTVYAADGVTNDGGLAIVGGGKLNVSSGNLRFEYNGRTTIELGTRVTMPTEKLGGGATFTIPAGLAPAIYNPLTITGSSTLESVFNAAVLPDDPNAHFQLSSDKKKIICLYGMSGVTGTDPIWIGGPSGNLGDGANWSTGTVPQGGNCYFSLGETATLTNSVSFRPDSITFMEGSQSVTINGTADITGITVITNLSAVDHTINVPVRFADKIRVQQGAMAWASRNDPKVVFEGGAYGTSIDETYSRFVSGHYILTDEDTAFVANQTLDVNRYGILAGSSLSVPYSTNLTHLLNGLGGDTAEAGGAFTTGVYRMSGTSVCRYNQGRDAEFVVTNELSMTLSGHKYLSYRKADGWFKFEKVTIGASSKNYTFYFANSGNSSGSTAYLYDKYVRIGAGGLNFEDGLANNYNPFYQFGRHNSDTVTITPWHGDFAIGTKGRSDKADVMFGCKTIFDTTDEGGIGRTITINALCASNNAVNVTGTGTVVVNNRANTCSGAVTVNGTATLALNAGCPLGTGAVTVTNATLRANSSGTVAFASNVVCKANSTLAFNFTEKRTAPCLVFNSETTGNAMPATLNIRITATDRLRPAGGRHTLTTGYDFTNTEFTLVDPPEWVQSVGKDAKGNIVLDVISNGTAVIIR